MLVLPVWGRPVNFSVHGWLCQRNVASQSSSKSSSPTCHPVCGVAEVGNTQDWICLLLAVCTEQEVNRSHAIQVVHLCVFRCSPELPLKLVASCDGKNLPTERLNQRDGLSQKSGFWTCSFMGIGEVSFSQHWCIYDRAFGTIRNVSVVCYRNGRHRLILREISAS